MTLASVVWRSGLCLCALSCNAERSTSPPPAELRTTQTSDAGQPAIDQTIAGMVLLEAGAPLYARPAEDAEQLRRPLEANRSAAAAHHSPFEVLEVRGDWIGVQNVYGEALRDTCALGSWLVVSLRARGWVRRTDLVPVLRRGIVERDAQGGTMHLAAGLPVERVGAEYVVVPDRIPGDLRVVVRPEEVGLSFHAMPTPSDRPIAIRRPDAPMLEFGGVPIPNGDVENDRAMLSQGGRRIFGLGAAVFAREERAGTLYVTVRTLCTRLQVREPDPNGLLEPEEVRSPPDEPAVWGALVMEPSTGEGLPSTNYRVEKGTRIYWPGGEPMGEFVFPHRFRHAPRVVGSRRCFALEEFQPPPEAVFCVEAGDIEAVTTSPGLPGLDQAAVEALRGR